MMNVVRRRTPSEYRRCAFTGHRLQKMPFGFNEDDPRCIAFKAQLRAAIEDLIGHGYAHFISGGALGMDMFAAEAVMDLKRDYPWVILEMAVPFEAQPAKWSQEYQNRYYRLMDDADIITCISRQYTKSCLFRRNRYLVDNADILLAAYDGQPGGTAMTVGYAHEMGIPVRTIMPSAQAA